MSDIYDKLERGYMGDTYDEEADARFAMINEAAYWGRRKSRCLKMLV